MIRVICGAQEQTTLRFLDGRMKTSAGTDLLAEYAVIGGRGNTELLEDIQVETPAPFLEGDLTIVDVPGMEDDPRRYAAIFRETVLADLVLSVHDVQQQMPLSELTLLSEEVIACGCNSLAVIVNKCNLLAPEEEANAALMGVVSRLQNVALRPLEPLRSWYRLDVQPELRRILAGEGHSVEFRTFLEDISQALRTDTESLQERRTSKLEALWAALQQGAKYHQPDKRKETLMSSENDERTVAEREYADWDVSLEIGKLGRSRPPRNTHLNLFDDASDNLQDILDLCSGRFTELEVIGEEWRDRHFKLLRNLTGVSSLKISGCERITDEALLHISKIKSLQTVDLSRLNSKYVTVGGLSTTPAATPGAGSTSPSVQLARQRRRFSLS